MKSSKPESKPTRKVAARKSTLKSIIDHTRHLNDRCQCADGQPIEEVVTPYRLRRAPFSKTHPEKAVFWFWEKNCGFAPDDFAAGSHVVPWWRCSEGPDHIWSEQINLFSRSNGCPFCQNAKLSCTNNFSILYPELAEEWHPTLNKYKASQLPYSAKYKAWWQCKSNQAHVWQATVSGRSVRGHGCQKCNTGESIDLRDYPSALKLFDKRKNKGIDPTNVHQRTKIWWHCKNGSDHQWYEGFKKSTGSKSCPFCRGDMASVTNNLYTIPHLAEEFHKSKNGSLRPEDINVATTKSIWWKCAKGSDHEWKQKVSIRVGWQYGCPFCANKKVSITNSLATLFPKVAREWHPTKNEHLKPSEVLAGSAMAPWWLCRSCGNEWKRAIYLRTKRQSGCPDCREEKEGLLRNRQTGHWLKSTCKI